MIRELVAFGLLALAPVGASAQVPAAPAAAAPDPALLVKSHQLMEVMRAREQAQKLIQTQLAQVMKGATDQAMAAMPKEAGITDNPEFKAIFDRYMQRLSSGMTTSMSALVPQMIDQMEIIYARNFSARELDDMTAFYQSPTGQAYIDRMPKVMGEYMTTVQAMMTPTIMKSIQPAAQQFMTELKAWAAKHPELKDRAK